MFFDQSNSSESDFGLSPASSSVCGALMSQFSAWSNLISLRTWCSVESSYTWPGVVVFDTRKPAWAKVFGVQISANVPPPPSVTHRLGYWPSQRLAQVGIGGVVVVVRIGAAAVAAEEAHIVDERVFAGFPQERDGARIDAAGKDAEAADDVVSACRARRARLGRAHPLISPASRIKQVELRQGRMQPDQHRVRSSA